MANNNIKVKVDVDYTEMTGLIKATGQTKQALNLVAKEFARTGDQKKYMAGINQIVSAQNKLDKSARMSRSEVMKLGTEMNQSAKFSNALAAATGGAAAQAGQMGRRMSRSGVMVQQAGYQIGDFIVQAQSGQNIMVAFGQQATQMAGTLTMLGGKFIGIGTALGIIIPLATAFGAALMRTRKASDDTAKSAKDLDDRLKALKSTLEDYANTMDALRQGVSLEELFATKGVDEALEKLKEAQAVLNSLQMGPQGASMTDGARRAGQESGNITSHAEALKAVISARTQLQLLLDKEADTRADNFAEASSQMQHELELLRAIEQHGEGSAQAKQAELAQELRIRLAGIDVQVASGELDRLAGEALKSQVKEAAALNSQIESNTEATTASAVAAERFARALRDAALAGQTLASLKFEFSAGGRAMALYASRGTVVDRQMEGALPEGYYDDPPSSSSSSGGSGGGKSDAEVMQEKITKLQEQLAVERELIGASEARVKIVRALGLEFVQNNPQVVDGLQEQINKTLELVQVEKDRQSVLDTIESSMSNGFMSMVEGTKSVKDAFRDMAKDIIKQLYDVYVIQRMVGAIGEGGAAGTGIMGFLGSILGRASGGTVMSNQPYLVGEKGPELIVPRNRGHVMNADLTSNAMGSGGGDIYITNSFTMAANGDDSVKRIIAQSMPAIVNASKQGVMDARRRGGSMKNTFG